MNRRRFLTSMGALTAGTLAQRGWAHSEKAPMIMGADTSDTLDLVARADLAINCLTRCTNPENDYACYVYVDLNRRPPVGKYQIRFYGKFMESLALMRRVTGSDVNLHVDRAWHDGIMQAWTASLATLDKPHVVMHNPEGGRQFAWLAGRWQDTGDDQYRDLGDLAIQHALKAATHQGDYCYFGPPEGMPLGWAATQTGWTVQGVSRYLAATESEAAFELASKLARYVKDHGEIFDEDAHFIARHESSLGPALHFHHNANALHGLMEFGLAAGDAEFVDFARRGYAYARVTSSPLVGFFPEYIDDWPDPRGVVDCEGCCVADMIQLALRRAQATTGTTSIGTCGTSSRRCRCAPAIGCTG